MIGNIDRFTLRTPGALPVVLAVSMVFSAMPGRAADWETAPSTGSAEAAPQPPSTAKTPDPKNLDDHTVRLNFASVSWPTVLKRVAKQSGLTLIMKRRPPGQFSRADVHRYTLVDAVRILNRELEPQGYRIVLQRNFLVVLDLEGLRSEYSPAAAHDVRPDSGSDSSAAADTAKTSRSDRSVRTASATGQHDDPFAAETTDGGSGVVTANRTEDKGEASGPSGSAARPSTSKPEKGDKPQEELRFRLNYFSMPWPQVLDRVAKQSGLTLVAKRCPAGTFQHPDFKKYTLAEAIGIINHELDQTDFRLVVQGEFLIVLDLKDVRTEYERPTLRSHRSVNESSETRASSAPENLAATPRSQTDILPVNATAGSERYQSSVANAIVTQPIPIERHFGETEINAQGSGREQSAHADDGETAETFKAVYALTHRRAELVAKKLYLVLKAQAELIDSGPEGLPSFRVRSAKDGEVIHATHSQADGQSRPRFTVGVDTDRNRLVVEASRPRCAALTRLFERLDQADEKGLQLVSAAPAMCEIAQSLGPQLSLLLAQRDSEERLAQSEPTPPPPAAGNSRIQIPTRVAPDQGRDLKDIIGGLKGDVTVESVPELGILILRGGQGDVEAVMKVIREIEKLSAGATAQVHLLPLQYVNSESFAALMNEVYRDLRGLRTGDRAATSTIHFYALVKPNAVLVIASTADMPSVLELAKKLDVPIGPSMEVQVFRLQRAYAAQVARAISEFYRTTGAAPTGGGAGGNAGGAAAPTTGAAASAGLRTRVYAIADPRTNSVIVQATGRDLSEISKLIERLDGPTASRATLKIFTLTNGDATTIVRLLDALFSVAAARQGTNGAQNAGAAPGAENEAGPTTLRLSADVRTNSIIALGAPDTLQAVYSVILRLDNTDAHQRKTVVIRLKNNGSDAVQRALNDFVRAQRDIATIDPELVSTVELLEREVFVVSEPLSNSLLISATPRYFDELMKMIDKLDASPAQVIIQALLVEVTLNNTDEFGIELGFQSPVLFDRSNITNPVSFTTTSTLNTNTTVQNQVLLSTTSSPGFQFGDPAQGLGSNPSVNQGTVGSQELTSFGLGRTNGNLGYGGLVLSASSESVSALLRALSQKETVHVLSRPQIRTVDNQVASIQVGKVVPVINSFIPNANGSLSPIVRQDSAGIILTVQPRITPEGMIVMHAYAEKSAFEPGGVNLVTDPVSGRTITSPIKDVTRAETTVSLASGNTVVMGGMITTSDDTIERKVPWAGDLPLIGQLFRYDSKTSQRTELLIFLTPRVLRNDADDEQIKQIETERLHFLVDEAEAVHGPILSNKCPDGVILPGMALPPGTIVLPSTPGAVVPGTVVPGPVMPGTIVPGTVPPAGPIVPGPGTLMPPVPPSPTPVPVPVRPRRVQADDPNSPAVTMPGASEKGAKQLPDADPNGQPSRASFDDTPKAGRLSTLNSFPEGTNNNGGSN